VRPFAAFAFILFVVASAGCVVESIGSGLVISSHTSSTTTRRNGVVCEVDDHTVDVISWTGPTFTERDAGGSVPFDVPARTYSLEFAFHGPDRQAGTFTLTAVQNETVIWDSSSTAVREGGSSFLSLNDGNGDNQVQAPASGAYELQWSTEGFSEGASLVIVARAC
jgi:hypothetical protein